MQQDAVLALVTKLVAETPAPVAGHHAVEP